MATFIVACQRYGKLTSGGLFLAWVLFALCGLPELHYWVVIGIDPSVFLRFNVLIMA
jgi:hypothetical protein